MQQTPGRRGLDSTHHVDSKRSLSADHERVRKRVKPSSTAELPPAVWQLVFTFLDPVSLCRVLRVNKLFNACLTDSTLLPNLSVKSRLAIRDSELIWSLSRTSFAPKLPSPLPGVSERTMLALVTGTHCQQCGRRSHMRCNLANIYHAGPGLDGVRIIWPFAIRLCGQCLADNTIKDVDLLVSPLAHLRPGMTYVFRAPALHYLPPWQVETKARPTVSLFKVYHLGLLDVLSREIDLVRQQGPEAVSEWQSTLPSRAKALREQSQIWHTWEAGIKGSISLERAVKDLCRPDAAISSEAITHYLPRVNIPPLPLPQTVGHAPGTYPPPARPALPMPIPMPMPQYGHAPGTEPAGPSQAVKDAKRADIERRCQTDIFPPILPGNLSRLGTFQAALQIPQPLDDHSWELLKVRLIGEREMNEELEYQRMTTASAIQSAFSRSIQGNRQNYKAGPDEYDRIEYESTQIPIRELLGSLADRHIKEHWIDGTVVTYSNVPDFAADVLVSVRNLYMQAIQDQGIQSSDHRAFLNLDSMKWVYEQKIKPIASRFSLELFICSICRNSRYYAFEGMIQHFGAKHDEDFGENNVIVQWRKAEWTEDPPFYYKGAAVQPARETSTLESRTTDATPEVGNALAAAASLLPSLLKAMPQAQSDRAGPAKNDSRQSTTDVYNLDLIASTAQVYWSSLADVMGMWNSVRLTAALHYAVQMYERQFGVGIDLDTLADALRRPSVREFSDVNDLACQTCVSSGLGSSEQVPGYEERIRDVLSESPLALIEHFKVVHSSSSTSKPSAWLNDMIEVPDDQDIRGLMTAVGMDDSKLAILAGAFPRIFPHPLPRIGTVTAAFLQSKLALAAQKPRKKTKSRDKKKREKSERFASREPEDVREAYDSMPEAAADEYDPRRPRFACNTAQGSRPIFASSTSIENAVGQDARTQRRDRLRRHERLNRSGPYSQEIPDFIRSSDLPDGRLDEPPPPPPPGDYPTARSRSHGDYGFTAAEAPPPYAAQATVTRMPELYSYNGQMYRMCVSHDSYDRQTSWLEPVHSNGQDRVQPGSEVYVPTQPDRTAYQQQQQYAQPQYPQYRPLQDRQPEYQPSQYQQQMQQFEGYQAQQYRYGQE